MASIHESSESTEQEEQDYIYGVVPKERCTLSKHGATRLPKKGEWLIYYEEVPIYHKYSYALVHILELNTNHVLLDEWWKIQGDNKQLKELGAMIPVPVVGRYNPKLSPVDGWFPITEEMAIKMRILHGF
jgi:hypothetical protein